MKNAALSSLAFEESRATLPPSLKAGNAERQV
jgi:hypothetical protein